MVTRGVARLLLTPEQEVVMDLLSAQRYARPADLEQAFGKAGLEPLRGPRVAAELTRGSPPLVEGIVRPRAGTSYTITKDGRRAVGRA